MTSTVIKPDMDLDAAREAWNGNAKYKLLASAEPDTLLNAYIDSTHIYYKLRGGDNNFTELQTTLNTPISWQLMNADSKNDFMKGAVAMFKEQGLDTEDINTWLYNMDTLDVCKPQQKEQLSCSAMVRATAQKNKAATPNEQSVASRGGKPNKKATKANKKKKVTKKTTKKSE